MIEEIENYLFKRKKNLVVEAVIMIVLGAIEIEVERIVILLKVVTDTGQITVHQRKLHQNHATSIRIVNLVLKIVPVISQAIIIIVKFLDIEVGLDPDLLDDHHRTIIGHLLKFIIIVDIN